MENETYVDVAMHHALRLSISVFIKYLRYNVRADWLATMFISEDRDMGCTKTLKIFYKSNIKRSLMSQI